MGQKRARSPSPPPPPLPSFKSSKSLKKSIRNQTDVALEITKQLFLNEEFGRKDENIVFSPLSIHVILCMITSGTEGKNQEDKLKFLKSKSINEVNILASQVYPLVFADGSQQGGPLLSFANGVWINQSLSVKPSFRNVVDTVYKAALKQVNFKKDPEDVRNEVNSWGENQTMGLIKSILPPKSVDGKTKFILANALYFKGDWDREFEASYTRVYDFELLNNAGSVKAPFMSKSYSSEFISVFKEFKVLKLPYKQGKDDKRKYSMYIFLPNETNGLPALIDQFCSNSNFIDNHIPKWEVDVDKFLIPKFKISFGFEALKLLETLGFSGGGLTEMVDLPVPLEVSKIFHKAFIEVNEKGTEAAAVTTSTDWEASCYCPETDFVADHPFLYLIREEVTKTVMFVGQILNPVEN